MHFLKSLLPGSKRPYPPNYRLYIQGPAAQQGNNLFPDRPIVAEASLKRYILLYQLIQRKTTGLWSPTYFGDLAVGSYPVHGQFKGTTGTRCINYQIST